MYSGKYTLIFQTIYNSNVYKLLSCQQNSVSEIRRKNTEMGGGRAGI
jgi:hypothetical protein